MEQHWRVIDTGANNGFMNMAIDEALMHSVCQGVVPPTLRFYRWNPPAVSLGFFQNLDREIDLANCRELGVDVVRRLTGGRAVLHRQEVTYSLVCPEKNPVAAGTIVQSYRRVSRGLQLGLKKLGLAVDLTPRTGKKDGQISPACFDAPSWYELVVRGKKLVGSAQTRKGGVMLQHGSIPLELCEKLLASVLRFSFEQDREIFIKSFTRRASAINLHLSPPVTYEQVIPALQAGLEEALGLILVPGKLTKFEQNLAKTLATKYQIKI